MKLPYQSRPICVETFLWNFASDLVFFFLSLPVDSRCFFPWNKKVPTTIRKQLSIYCWKRWWSINMNRILRIDGSWTASKLNGIDTSNLRRVIKPQCVKSYNWAHNYSLGFVLLPTKPFGLKTREKKIPKKLFFDTRNHKLTFLKLPMESNNNTSGKQIWKQISTNNFSEYFYTIRYETFKTLFQLLW